MIFTIKNIKNINQIGNYTPKKKNFNLTKKFKAGTYIFDPNNCDYTGHYYSVIYYLNKKGQEVLKLTNIIKIIIYKDQKALKWFELLELWKSNNSFIHFFVSTINNCNFNEYFFECPKISFNMINSQIFEFRLIKYSKPFPSTDLLGFKDQRTKNSKQSIITFPNLSHTSTLIIPNKLK